MSDLTTTPVLFYRNYLQILKKDENDAESAADIRQKRDFLKANTRKETDDLKKETRKKIGAEVQNVGASNVAVSSQEDALNDMVLQARKDENFMRQEARNQLKTLSRKLKAISHARQYDYGLGVADLFGHFN